MSFSVPDEASAQLLRLVASCSGRVAPLDISVGGAAEFTAADGKAGSGLNTACRYVASLSPAAQQLLGKTPEQQAKIAEWASFRNTSLHPLLDAQLAELNDALASRTYIAGGSRHSLADLLLYAAVSPAAVAFPVAQHGHFCNLLRWYDLLHHTADTQRIFPAAKFERTRYVAPPPPPPAEPKAPKDKAGGEKKAAPATAEPVQSSSSNGDKKAGKAAASSAVAAAPADADAVTKADKKPKKDKAAQPATPAASGEPSKGGDELSVDLLDIRVGQIVKVGRHPNADALYVEDIDLGEASGPRQVVSGLVKFVPEERMQGRRVVVVCNLKPAKMRDVMSYGMVLCASNDAHDQVDPIIPPEGVPLGERVTFEGYSKEPEAQLNPKKKQFEKLAPFLRVDAGGICEFRGTHMMTSKGPVTATLNNSWIK
ncbi:hypothetical protein D9Q98_004532 [Chlorella vulgaris]|uniref:tRNA-binding domain-containing protein n=1 Tax=Chlorella vulgaris TaxID=3077 RepID=A0A9D4TPS8_CHLVU|nr:hypothetical protein D9Q98_004532 [Chlorella vulgaris]